MSSELFRPKGRGITRFIVFPVPLLYTAFVLLSNKFRHQKSTLARQDDLPRKGAWLRFGQRTESDCPKGSSENSENIELSRIIIG